MAINKVVNSGGMSHGAMRNVLEYILKEEKTSEGLCEINGPYSGIEPHYDQICQDWVAEKKAWNKDSGRMYAHNIISFHKDEDITPEQVLDIARNFSDKFFHGHQYVIAVHQDREHLHAHIVTNTVSFLDGRKLHQSRHDLQEQKDYTNGLCKQMGLTVAEKGKHFDGSRRDIEDISLWDKDKYKMLSKHAEKSFIADCFMALMDVTDKCTGKEEFISDMADRGWTVKWEDNRKHIVYENEKGEKVRDSNLEKTFPGLPATKEALINEFKRNAAKETGRERAGKTDRDLEEYYAEVRNAISGADDALKNEGTDRSTGNQQTTSTRREAGKRRIPSGTGDGEEQEFNSFISEYRAKEGAGGKSVEASIRSAEASNRASDSLAAERRSEEQRRPENEKRDRENTEEKSRIRRIHR